MTQVKRSDAGKVREIRRIINRGKVGVASAGIKPGVNRSTRARHALVAKAEAFDRVQDVLAGRK